MYLLSSLIRMEFAVVLFAVPLMFAPPPLAGRPSEVREFELAPLLLRMGWLTILLEECWPTELFWLAALCL